MLLGRLRLALRGAGGAARTFVGASALPLVGDPDWLVLVPAAALAVAGLGTGRSTTGGLVGRLRTAVSRVRSGRHAALKRAAVAGAVVAAGFAVASALVAALHGAGAGGALVSGLLLGLVVCVPAAVVGARR